MKSLSLLPFLLLPFLLSAQKFTLRGTLGDTSTQPIIGATVMLLAPKDSSLLSFTRTNVEGVWDFKNLSSGEYLLRATYFGYKNFQQKVTLGGAEPVVDLGKINMEVRSNLLNEVEIKGEANPVTFRNDTIEFNAGSFKVKDNAVVEDLLKKLPGVDVAKDGTITAQGKEVQNVTVEGKKFFGNDPKMATQNLPADAVKKVQVFDKKSEASQFTGVDDGTRERTINLDLKDDKKKGWFGKIIGGGGVSEGGDFRYEGRTTLNSFKPKRQISILGMANNVNQAGFSIDDYMAFSGAMRSMMGGGGGRISLQFDGNNMPVPLDFGNNNGFINTYAGGLNFNQEYGKKNNFNGSYFYSRSDKNMDENTLRTSSLSNGQFATTSNSAQENITDNHRINFTLDQRIDSFNTVQLTSNFLHTTNEQQQQAFSQTTNGNGAIQNEGSRDYYSDANASNWSGSALWRHRFKNKKGRNFTTNFDFGLNENNLFSNSTAPNRLYANNGQLIASDTIAQEQDFNNHVTNWGAKATYTEPLGKKRYLEFNYGYFKTVNKADKDVYDTNNGEKSFNNLLSNAYENTFGYHRGGVGFRLNRKTWNMGVGVDYQSALLEGIITEGQGAPVSKTYQHILPRTNVHIELKQNRNIDLNYSASVDAPTVSQLQPVPDISDPLNISEGNPNLRPEYAHNVNLNFMNFNPENFSSLFGGIFATVTQDKIVMAQSVDPQTFVRSYTPINTDLAMNLSAQLSYGMRIKKLDSRFRLSLRGSVNQGEGLINGGKNETTTTTFGPGLSWDFEPADWFTFSSEARFNWNETSYSIDRNFNQNYLSQTYNNEVNIQFGKGFAFNSSLDLTINNGYSDGFDQPIPIWNATFSKFLLKGKKLEVALTVRDILNRNVGISRTANLNYVEDRSVSSLGRVGLLRLTYSLNSLGGPGGPGGPRMRIMMRN
ncbi:MAG: outer membrane beta-barrel protein [Saprospiraceae bacterium]|nr:outer membrane beta-barrel protein [Saprospiraceae bacterium]